LRRARIHDKDAEERGHEEPNRKRRRDLFSFSFLLGEGRGKRESLSRGGVGKWIRADESRRSREGSTGA
jgi:hypothetical protein